MTSTNERPDPLTARGIKLQGEYFADCNLLMNIIAKGMESHEELEQQVKELVAQVGRLRGVLKNLVRIDHKKGGSLGPSGAFYYKVSEHLFGAAESVLSEPQPAALDALKAQLQGEIIKEFLEMLDESISIERDAGRNVSGDIIEMIGRAARKFKQRAQEAGDE